MGSLTFNSKGSLLVRTVESRLLPKAENGLPEEEMASPLYSEFLRMQKYGGEDSAHSILFYEVT